MVVMDHHDLRNRRIFRPISLGELLKHLQLGYADFCVVRGGPISLMVAPEV